MASEDPRLCTMIAGMCRAIQHCRRFGASSRLAKAVGDTSLAIRSTSTERSLIQRSGSFLRHAHYRHGVMRLAQLRPHHGASWVQRARAPNAQATRLQHLRFLERLAAQVIGIHVRLVPSGLQIARVAVGTGQWSPSEQAAILAYIAARCPDLVPALRIGAHMGLRPSEIEAITVGAVGVDATVLHVPGIKWRHRRDMNVPEALRTDLQRLAIERQPDAPLFPGATKAALQTAIREAREALGLPDNPVTGKPRSMMAYRGAAAERIYEAALADGASEPDARRAVARELGHGPNVRLRLDVARDSYLRRSQEEA